MEKLCDVSHFQGLFGTQDCKNIGIGTRDWLLESSEMQNTGM
uniref:Uncharacterized protein n=1 Tax=Arundo donax TaxID=35708 RepID=A0A0A8YME7_ARUDO